MSYKEKSNKGEKKGNMQGAETLDSCFRCDLPRGKNYLKIHTLALTFSRPAQERGHRAPHLRQSGRKHRGSTLPGVKIRASSGAPRYAIAIANARRNSTLRRPEAGRQRRAIVRSILLHRRPRFVQAFQFLDPDDIGVCRWRKEMALTLCDFLKVPILRGPHCFRKGRG